ncbi:Sca4 family spreading effector [Rickettsia endosymbiont of Urophora cardui]|uniref:Sca4 family spreading effector n=1 Tax=Rickettsia endosymbiont of Urophora cardui TaxID=3066265 RepID=UPI00313E2B90
MQNNHNTDEQSTAELLEEFEKKYNYRGSKEVNLTKMQNSDTGMQEQVTEETAAQDSVSFGTSGVGISLDSEGVDPITESIRQEILQKQREQLRLFFSTMHPELEEHTLDDERFKKFLMHLNNEQRTLVSSALENEQVKAAMEEIELVGYKNIHTRFSSSNYLGGFKPMDWSGFAELSTRSQIVYNGVGDEICTLKEQTHKTSPLTISKQDGSTTIVNAYRTIDFPVELHEPASGTMHLSLVAKDKDGQAPSVTKAVYFTAHYEATPKPNGVPKLKEVSSPQPLQFLGSSIDSVGYIEHGGEIYTLPVTKGKYEEMMKEVARNKGQAVDLSLEVEPQAQDLIGVASGVLETRSDKELNGIVDSKEEQIKHHEAQIARYKKILEEHIEPALECRDQEREQILLLTKKCLTEPKYKEFESYIKKTAEQHIELHHEAYLKEADGGKSLKELTEIMNNIGYEGFTSENSKDSSKSTVGKIKDVLKAGGKLGFNIVLESLKAGGVENYVKQRAIEESKKVGSYVANSIADRIRATLSGKSTALGNNSVAAEPCKSYVAGINQGASKSSGILR